MSTLFLEQAQIVEAFPAADLSAAAQTGDWVSLSNYRHIAVVFHSEPGTAGDDPTITIQQAQDNAAAGAKALNFTTLYSKQAATNLAGTGQWTKVTQAASNTYDNNTSAEQDLIWVVEFDAEDLDFENGFEHLNISVNDVGTTAQLGYAYYVLTQPGIETKPESMISAL